ncbi:hypothetical protein ACGFIE_30950 [Micromonospora sp. NPDC049275]|uniref:hypothetical protein n=1 Tax=Micromonospora sp. NPDC049275 TaxID=3364268 RepID=UPI0037128869
MSRDTYGWPRWWSLEASDLYPWQGCEEWLLFLSATRYEHADFTAVRPAAPLPLQ